MKRQILAGSAATLAAAALIGTGLAATTYANAATHPGAASTSTTNAYVSQTTGVHNAPNSKAPVTQVLTAGTAVTARCVEPLGSEEDGNTIWFRIATNQPGGGWVPRAALGGVPDLPKCSAGGQ